MKSVEPPNSPPVEAVPHWLQVLVGIPLILLGGFVTFLFGLVLSVYLMGRIAEGWQPQPNLINFLSAWLLLGAAPVGLGVLLLRSQSKRFWSRTILTVFLLFLCVGADGNFGPRNWHGLFRREKLPGSDAASLKQTVVSPHLEEPIIAGTNVLWCGTFQLAWNEACDLCGGDLQFDRTNTMITALNKHAFTKDSLDSASYVAAAGFVKDKIHDKTQKVVNEKFQGLFKPRFLPDKKITPRPQDFITYACLYKNLSFATAFERFDQELVFAETRVRSFGFKQHEVPLTNMHGQVLILDYQTNSDFIIELKTKSDGDRLILAKMLPKNTIGETVAEVRRRISQSSGEVVTTNDVLVVPKIKFDLTRRYSELEELWLKPRTNNVAGDLILRSAVQNTWFDLNEKGVELKSEAHMAFGCAMRRPPARKHEMIFNKPFLILMERTNAKTPYFALWIDNPELLIRW